MKARRRSPPPERRTKNLCADDFKESSSALCMIAQIESFEEEYKELQANRALSSKNPLLPLQPFLMEGVIRVGGRLNKAWIPFEAKHQTILSPTHPLTRLLVQHLHEKHSHVGREHTLVLVRQQYWIPRRKTFVRKIVNDCLHYKKRRAKPNVPLMASLPEERLAFGEPPFANPGVDYFGSMNVKRARVVGKRWGCLFTCLTTRMVHVELEGDLSTDSFIMRLRRFRGRRGNHSDKGSNFVGAKRELTEALTSLSPQQISRELAHEGITSYFNPPSSPAYGRNIRVYG